MAITIPTPTEEARQALAAGAALLRIMMPRLPVS